jgi:flagellar hook assembly protein FlgD
VPSATATPVDQRLLASQNSPVVIRGNVFKPAAHRPVEISLFLAKPEHVKVKIYSLRGRLIKSIADEMVTAGRFETVWEGINANGEVVRSGIYIIDIEAESFKEKRKVAVVR